MKQFDRNRWQEPGSSSAAPAADFPNADADGELWMRFAKAKTREAFCQSWLALQCRIIGGVSGGLVLLGPPDSGPFAPIGVWPSVRHTSHLTEAVQRALRERRPLILKHELNSNTGGPVLDRYYVAYPVEVAGRLHGVIVLDITPRPEPQLQEVLRQLQWGFGWIEVIVGAAEARNETSSKERLQKVFDLIGTTLEQERFLPAATAFVTALANHLGCDRVSVGLAENHRVCVKALSHSAQFAKETNLIRSIASAMDEALDQRMVIVYPSRPDAKFQVTRGHAELSRQYGAEAVCSVPMSYGGEICGVLTLERPTDHPFDDQTIELCEAIASLAGPVLELHRREDRWFISKALETARTQLNHLIGPRHIAKKLIAALVVGLIFFFSVAKTTYRVTAKVVIEPVIQRAAVAPFDGYISEARVRAGDVVRQDQVLCVLDDRDLNLERTKLVSQREQFVRQYEQALGNREAAQIRIVEAQIDQSKAQLVLLEDRLSRTRVIAPFNAVVVKGDLSQNLGSPVERGQVLFELAPLEAYQVVLQVDERDISHLSVGQQGSILLSPFPTERLSITVEKLTPISTAREGRNYFRVEGRLHSTLGRLRPGMEGVGKIEIDRRRLIWIWTHEVLDWLRLMLWSWLP